MASGRRDVDDYSFSRPAMGALAHGVMRYLYGNGKGLTASEVATLRGAGKILGLNYEAGAGDFNGPAAGRAHAVAAAQLAARLPVAKAPIIFSADWPVTTDQFRAVGDALEAAAGVLGWGWVGLYGHAGLMDYIAQRFGAAAYRWQTYAWSGGRVSTAADLYQFLNGQNVAGGQVDFNQIVGRNFLTALGGSLTSQDGSAVLIPTTSEEDDMAQVPQEQWDQAFAALGQLNQLLGPTGDTTGKIDETKQWVGDIRGGMEGMPSLFAAIKLNGGAPLDAETWAKAVAADLGPNMGKQFVAALAQQLGTVAA